MADVSLTDVVDHSGLDEQQLKAVTHEDFPLCVLANAGSGKTRVLTRRVDFRVKSQTADPNHCLVLTFTRKAALELRARLRALGVDGVTAGTFHAIAYAQLKQYWHDNGRSAPVVTGNPIRHVESALHSLSLDRTTNARSCLAEISWAKAHGLNFSQYVDAVSHFRRRAPLPPQKMIKVWSAYEAEKKKRGVVDFDDLLLVMVSVMRTDKGFAASQRWKFRHFFVDEFQDLNRAQFNLLRAWIGMRDDLFVVGDPDQAIYGFNGADAGYLTGITSHFPNMEVMRLTTNYRSTPQVLAAGDAVLGRPSRREGVPGVAPTLRQYGDEKIEAIGIANQLRVSCGGRRSWNDAAVLVRTNAQRGVIEDALSAAGIPVRSGGGASWLHRIELREMVDYMRANESRRLIEIIGDLSEMAATSDAPVLALELVEECRMQASEDVNATVRDALAQLEVSSRFDAAPGASGDSDVGVTVTTFHRAKGLEWPIVMLAGLENGLVPMTSNSSPSQLEEERRLLYVAITRAREELHCSFAAQRLTSKGVVHREPSPWLTTLAKARIDDVGLSVPEVNAAVDSVRQVLLEPVEIAETPAREIDIRDGLAAWRDQRRRLTGIAPELILKDSVIDAVAKADPQSMDELGEIEGIGKIKAQELWKVLSGVGR